MTNMEVVIFDIRTSSVSGDLLGAMLVPLVVAVTMIFFFKLPRLSRLITAFVCILVALSSAWKLSVYELNRRELSELLTSRRVHIVTGTVVDFVPQKFERGAESFKIGDQRFSYGRNAYKPFFGTTKRKLKDIGDGDLLEVAFLMKYREEGCAILRVVKKTAAGR